MVSLFICIAGCFFFPCRERQGPIVIALRFGSYTSSSILMASATVLSAIASYHAPTGISSLCHEAQLCQALYEIAVNPPWGAVVMFHRCLIAEACLPYEPLYSNP